MKRLIAICLVCVLLTAAASQGAVSQGMVISFDENGNGDVDGTPLVSGIDTPPIGHETLYYVLSATFVSTGDVKIMEPGTTDEISDVLRFVNLVTAQQARVYVYSEREAGDPLPYDLADTGLPTEFQSIVRSLTEEGTEGSWNGLHYTASGSTDPGNLMGGPVNYVFTSDVPEPATLVLLGTAGIWIFTRKKHQFLGGYRSK